MQFELRNNVLRQTWKRLDDQGFNFRAHDIEFKLEMSMGEFMNSLNSTEMSSTREFVAQYYFLCYFVYLFLTLQVTKPITKILHTIHNLLLSPSIIADRYVSEMFAPAQQALQKQYGHS